MSEPFLGEIRMVVLNFAPMGWSTCEGQALSIAQNFALFSLLGTTFGGNGVTTFKLPDLRGRNSLHAGQGNGPSPRRSGEYGGAETVTRNVNQMPAHQHAMLSSSSIDEGYASNSTNVVPANSDAKTYAPSIRTNPKRGADTCSISDNYQPCNLPPLPATNFVIALEGIFPFRP